MMGRVIVILAHVYYHAYGLFLLEVLQVLALCDICGIRSFRLQDNALCLLHAGAKLSHLIELLSDIGAISSEFFRSYCLLLPCPQTFELKPAGLQAKSLWGVVSGHKLCPLKPPSDFPDLMDITLSW